MNSDSAKEPAPSSDKQAPLTLGRWAKGMGYQFMDGKYKMTAFDWGINVLLILLMLPLMLMDATSQSPMLGFIFISIAAIVVWTVLLLLGWPIKRKLLGLETSFVNWLPYVLLVLGVIFLIVTV